MHLDKKECPYADSLTNLAVSRSLQKSNAEVVNERVRTATKTLYALMPSGLHGENGLSPSVSRKIITAYILPRLLYGLEALTLSKSEMACIDRA